MKYIRKIALTALSIAYIAPVLGAAYAAEPACIYSRDHYSILDYTLMVAPQDGADCGLHAVKNSLALFNYLTHTIDLAERNKQLQGSVLGSLGGMSDCREIIGIPNGNIYPEELISLLDMHDPIFNLPYKNCKFLILDNLLRPDVLRTNRQNKQLTDIINNIRTGIPFVHALVLGNMNQDIQQSGHWIACVLERNELGAPLILHTANSSASFVHADEDVRQAVQEFDRTMGQQLIQFLNMLNPLELPHQTAKVEQEHNSYNNLETFSDLEITEQMALFAAQELNESEVAARALQLELDAEYALSLSNQ